MLQYSFNAEIAKQYGVDAAIFIHYLYYWIEKNQANEKHSMDGRTWTYNSTTALINLFPFWKKGKINNLIEKLEKEKVIFTGNFNRNKFDRTRWFALSDEILGYYQSLQIGFPVKKPEVNQGEKPDSDRFPKMGKSSSPNMEMAETENSQNAGFPDSGRFPEMEKSKSQNVEMDFPKRRNGFPEMGKSDFLKSGNGFPEMRTPIPYIDPLLEQNIDPLQDLPMEEIKKLFNQICTKLPKVKYLSKSMKENIRLAFAAGYTLEDFEQLFQMAQASDYLTGATGNGWVATFDWLIQEDNMVKVLNGNYAKRQPPKREASYDMDALQYMITYANPMDDVPGEAGGYAAALHGKGK